MKKRLLALALSASMVMGMAMTASAAPITSATEGAYVSSEFSVETTVNAPKISVTVPASQADICINPYGLEYTVDNTQFTDKVVTIAQEIENGSDVAVQVNIVDIKAEIGSTSDIVLASAPLPAAPKNKGVFLYVDAVEGAATAATFSDYNKTNDNQYVITSKATTKNNIIQLAAKPASGDAPKASYKICGDVVTTPPTAWASTDTIKITYKLSFTPVIPKT